MGTQLFQNPLNSSHEFWGTDTGTNGFVHARSHTGSNEIALPSSLLLTMARVWREAVPPLVQLTYKIHRHIRFRAFPLPI